MPIYLHAGFCPHSKILPISHDSLSNVPGKEANTFLYWVWTSSLTFVSFIPEKWRYCLTDEISSGLHLFPVKGEPFLSRQNRRSGLTETTASFAAPGLPKLKKRVYVLLRKEFLCFLLLAIPGRCSLRYINVCAQQGKNAADRGGGCEMKQADPHSGFFCPPLNAFTSGAPFSLQLEKM